MKRPSELLAESAAPFDRACTQVRDLEEAAINLMDGMDHGDLDGVELDMFLVMAGMGLLEVRNGYVKEKVNSTEADSVGELDRKLIDEKGE